MGRRVLLRHIVDCGIETTPGTARKCILGLEREQWLPRHLAEVYSFFSRRFAYALPLGWIGRLANLVLGELDLD
jgi:hypothetical protein